MRSPLTNNENVHQIDTVSVDRLISGYKDYYNIDVSLYFKNIDELQIYLCEETSYMFYFPFNLSGDSGFYEELQKFDWYYDPWKWEHETTKKFLKKSDRILEVGSGGLGFIKKLNDSGFDVTGLELNSESVIQADQMGLNVFGETVQYHAENYSDKYDVVCSFQVLEHISQVHSFIQAKIDCLKSRGRLIISVPNNDSFIKLDKNLFLNMPPHHMGLWNKTSLMALSEVFDLKVENIIPEPLAQYHLDWYINLNVTHRILKSKIFGSVFRKLKLRSLYSFLVKSFRKSIKGHTILIVFTKY